MKKLPLVVVILAALAAPSHALAPNGSLYGTGTIAKGSGCGPSATGSLVIAGASTAAGWTVDATAVCQTVETPQNVLVVTATWSTTDGTFHGAGTGALRVGYVAAGSTKTVTVQMDMAGGVPITATATITRS